MTGAIVVGVVLGVLATLGLRRRHARSLGREARSRERFAAILLYEEVRAAVDAVDLALNDESSKWLASMSESITLTEAWREQAQALQGIDADDWQVLSDTVSEMAPSYSLGSATVTVADRRRSLTERRELLEQSAEILLRVRDHRRRKLLPDARRPDEGGPSKPNTHPELVPFWYEQADRGSPAR